MKIFPDIPMFQNWRQSTLVLNSSQFPSCIPSHVCKAQYYYGPSILIIAIYVDIKNEFNKHYSYFFVSKFIQICI